MRGWLVLLAAAGCQAEPPPPSGDDDDATVEPPPEEWTVGDEVLCADPGPLRLTEEAFVRGVTPDTSNRVRPDGELWVTLNVSAVDADLDGDVDLFFGSAGEQPQAYINDGTGSFERAEIAPWIGSEFPANFALVDLTDDDLPDLVAFESGGLEVAENLGDFAFADFARWWEPEPGPVAQVSTQAWGDADGDGDLDLWLAGLELFEDGSPVASSSPDRLLLNDGGSFSLAGEFFPNGETGLSIVAGFTDRDFDGDQDVLALSDRPVGRAPTAFWRNDGLVDGLPVFVDDAEAVGAALPLSGMGLIKADFNGDEVLDYCVTDTGPLVCLLSFDGGYIEGAASMGLTQPAKVDNLWSGWSLELVDLDADGYWEVPVAAGPPGENFIDDPKFAATPNGLFVGGPGGWTEQGEAFAFDRAGPYFGLAAADLTGDFFPDVVTVGPGVGAAVYVAGCTEGAWLRVELVGPQGNPQGWGARVVIDDQIREVTGPRGHGQGPGWIHAGLGDATEADVTVHWPDGTSTAATVPTRRRVVVRHGSRL